MKALIEGIYSLFNAAVKPAFYNNMSGGMHLIEAPQNTAFPYAVFELIDDDYDFTFTSEFSEILIEFNIFDDDSSVSNIGTYFENLKMLYDWAMPEVTGYTVVKMEREFADLDKDDGVWQYMVQYRILLEKN